MKKYIYIGNLYKCSDAYVYIKPMSNAASKKPEKELSEYM